MELENNMNVRDDEFQLAYTRRRVERFTTGRGTNLAECYPPPRATARDLFHPAKCRLA